MIYVCVLFVRCIPPDKKECNVHTPRRTYMQSCIHHITLQCIALYCVAFRYIHCVALCVCACHVVLRGVTLCYVVLRCATQCYQYVVLRCVTLCHVVLHYIQTHTCLHLSYMHLWIFGSERPSESSGCSLSMTLCSAGFCRCNAASPAS